VRLLNYILSQESAIDPEENEESERKKVEPETFALILIIAICLYVYLLLRSAAEYIIVKCAAYGNILDSICG